MVTKALAKVEKQPFGLVKVPEYLRGQGQKGLEEVGRDDMILPRLAIAQSGSPAFKKASRDRIEGLEEGDLYNTLTRVIYGDKVNLIPVLFFKSFIKFGEKKDGEAGGIQGIKRSVAAFEQATKLGHIKANALEFGPDGEKPEWTEFRNFVCWIPDKKDMVVVSMKSTDTKAAKMWISFMRMAAVPAYGKVYQISTVPVNKNNYDFFGFEVQPTGEFTPEDLFHECDKLYASLSGKELKIDVEGLAAEEVDAEKAPF